jgi:hypothetical protein
MFSHERSCLRIYQPSTVRNEYNLALFTDGTLIETLKRFGGTVCHHLMSEIPTQPLQVRPVLYTHVVIDTCSPWTSSSLFIGRRMDLSHVTSILSAEVEVELFAKPSMSLPHGN